MYCSVPTSAPCAVIGVLPGGWVSLLNRWSAGARASPKSSSFVPDRVSITLAGFRSR